MVEYLHIPCPNCRHVLRVRKQYVGIEVTCTRCDHSFLVEESQNQTTPQAMASSATNHETCEKQIAELKGEMSRVQQDYAKVVAENMHVAEELKRLNEQYSQSETRVRELEQCLAESQDVIRKSETLIKLESLDQLLVTEGQDEASSAESGKSPLMQDIRQLRDERDRLADAERAHARALAEAQANLEELRRTLSEVTADHQATRDKLQQEFESSRESWMARRQELEGEIANERRHRQTAEEQLDEIKTRNTDDGPLRDERDRLARELDEAQQRAKQLEDELRSLVALTELPGNANTPQSGAPQNDELNERLRLALDENERLRSLVRDLGISV